jgi:hypothetical protein
MFRQAVDAKVHVASRCFSASHACNWRNILAGQRLVGCRIRTDCWGTVSIHVPLTAHASMRPVIGSPDGPGREGISNHPGRNG